MCQQQERHGCMVRCAWRGCNRPFVICELCEAAQIYCSDDCKQAARKEQVRRARRKYASGHLAKRKASKRKVRYRARLKNAIRAKFLQKIGTDHASTQGPAGVTDSLDEVRAADGSPVGAKEGPCHDVDSQHTREHRETRGMVGLLGADIERAPSLGECRFCGAPVHLFVDRDRLRARVWRRRRPSGTRPKRRPRLPVGPD